MTERVGVAVVGTGVLGLAIARELARAGSAPLVLARSEPGRAVRDRCGRTRIVWLTHDRADDVRDAMEAMVLWRKLERDVGVDLLVRVGSLDLGARVDATMAALDACGVPAEHLEPQEAERRFPSILAGGGRAVFQADGSIAIADAVLHALASDAVRHGARIRTSSRVERIEPHADCVCVRTTAGTVRARGLVLVAGPSLVAVAAQVGVSPLVRTTRRTLMQLALRGAPPEPMPAIVDRDSEGRLFHALSDPGGDGVEGALHSSEPPADAEEPKSDGPLAEPLRAWMARRLVGVAAELNSSSYLCRWHPDDRFHVLRTGRVVTVSSCGGPSYRFTPLIGARAAALAYEPLEA